ncbi:MAG: ABC transporter ATP-binding protein [Candidatus Falkowbacteria bacterium]
MKFDDHLCYNKSNREIAEERLFNAKKRKTVDPIISLKNINFVYNKGKDNEFQALINVNLEIYPEEFIIIFGPSGCGKSSLLNVLAGLETPDSGTISILGKDMMTLSKRDFAWYHRNQLGMIYQAYNLITSLTVLENVALPQIFLNVRKRKREKWSLSLLERFGIVEHAQKIPTELSGGQQQRIGIARSIVNNPKLILADEPVGNLDSVSAQNVFDILEELNEKEKKTIILVTHNPENLDYADRIIYMKDGIITREVVNREKHKKEKKIGPGAEVKSAINQMEDLMRAYHGLSPEQINILIMPYKAKVFAHHFITTRNMEETRVFEESIQRRLLGTISQEELYDILHRNLGEGGVGFDKRTTDKILRRVNRIIRMAYFVYQKDRQRKDTGGEHVKIDWDEKTEKLTSYLLMSCYQEYYKHLDKEQTERLKKVVHDRIVGNINKAQFFAYLDQPLHDGGVGLNRKTARAITEEIELILILGFGIVEMMHQRQSFMNRNAAGLPPKPEPKIKEDIPASAAEESGLKPVIAPERETPPGPEAIIDPKEAEMIINDIISPIGDVGMKDFASIMNQAKLKLKGSLPDDKLGELVTKAILSRR